MQVQVNANVSARETSNFFDTYCNEEAIVSNDETEIYLNEPCIRIIDNMGALNYWKTNAVRFPVLSKMAKDFLSIPASSAAIESQFSIAGHLFSARRSRMKPETLEKLVLLHDWKRII